MEGEVSTNTDNVDFGMECKEAEYHKTFSSALWLPDHMWFENMYKPDVYRAAITTPIEMNLTSVSYRADYHKRCK